MTCIVGIATKGKVYLGGDSAAVSELHIQVRKDKKVFHNGPLIMGFTTSFRMGQILEHELIVPKDTYMDAYKFMVKSLIPEIRTIFKDHGYDEGGVFLIGYKGRLFLIAADYQVAENLNGIASCGCGSKYALGSLLTSTGNPVKRLQIALEVATELNGGVRPPFNFVSN